ncbi:GntR family transcriptional regulator [Catenovulum sp. SM1970]|nr:GntR family transcriptional regulator [Marinifaba aquimaris]
MDSILMQLNLDPHSGTPIYRQLVEQLTHLITAKQLKTGDKLPSVRKIAEQFSINPMTISKAFGQLESQGLVIRERGKGMTVAAREQQNERDYLATRLALIQPNIEQLAMQAKQLDLTQEDILTALAKQMSKTV